MGGTPQLPNFIPADGPAPQGTQALPSFIPADGPAPNASSATPNTIAPMRGPSLSDFVPNWMTVPHFLEGAAQGVGSLATGVAHSILHPIQTVEGAAQPYQNVKRDIHSRQYMSAVADALAFGGFDEAKLAQMWGQGQGAQATGQATPMAFLDAETIGRIPKTVEAVKNLPQTLSNLKSTAVKSFGPGALKEMRIQAAAARDLSANSEAERLAAAGSLLKEHAQSLVNDIGNEDLAELQERGVEGGSISASKSLNALRIVKDKLQQINQSMPKVQSIERLYGELPQTDTGLIDGILGKYRGGIMTEPADVTFEQARQLRGAISEVYDKASASEQKILAQASDELRSQMSNRADELGLKPQFDAYNKMFSTLFDHRDNGLLGKLLEAPDSKTFYGLIEDSNNAAKIKQLESMLEPYGYEAKSLENSLDRVRTLHEFLKNPSSSSFIGILNKIRRYPKSTIAGMVAGGQAPGLGWYGRLGGAWLASNMAERLAVVRTLENLGIDTSKALGNPLESESGILPGGARGPAAPNPGAPPVSGGATLAEQMAAKGQTLLKPEDYAAPQGGHAGGGVASEEELARPGRFVKINRSGMPTDIGKSPDFGELKPGEAGYQVMPNGTFELRAGQQSPTTDAAMQKYLKARQPSAPISSARHAEAEVSAQKLGPEFKREEIHYLKRQMKNILNNPKATLEERQQAARRLREINESAAD